MTEDQRDLIEKVTAMGFGYAKFARSVAQHGTISIKQEEVLKRMLRGSEDRRLRGYTYNKHNFNEPDISDCEAMRSHDFF